MFETTLTHRLVTATISLFVIFVSATARPDVSRDRVAQTGRRPRTAMTPRQQTTLLLVANGAATNVAAIHRVLGGARSASTYTNAVRFLERHNHIVRSNNAVGRAPADFSATRRGSQALDEAVRRRGLVHGIGKKKLSQWTSQLLMELPQNLRNPKALFRQVPAKPEGTPEAMSVLLAASCGHLKATDVADFTGLHKRAVYSVLQRLHRRGLVDKRIASDTGPGTGSASAYEYPLKRQAKVTLAKGLLTSGFVKEAFNEGLVCIDRDTLEVTFGLPIGANVKRSRDVTKSDGPVLRWTRTSQSVLKYVSIRGPNAVDREDIGAKTGLSAVTVQHATDALVDAQLLADSHQRGGHAQSKLRLVATPEGRETIERWDAAEGLIEGVLDDPVIASAVHTLRESASEPFEFSTETNRVRPRRLTVLLLTHLQPSTNRDIAERSGLSSSSVVHILRRLQKSGWVEVSGGIGTGRVGKVYTATDTGQAVLPYLLRLRGYTKELLESGLL